MGPEFWIGYVVAGAKFFLIGMIWGQIRAARLLRRLARERGLL